MRVDDLVPVNGKRLRAYRKQRDWSQAHLADRAQVSRSYVAEIERGKKNPRLLYAKALAEALSVTVDDLIGSAKLRQSAGQTPRSHQEEVAV